MKQLETISEAICSELEQLDELKKEVKSIKTQLDIAKVKNNIELYNEEVYAIFEKYQGIDEEVAELKNENAILKELLKSMLSFNDLIYLQNKYSIYLD